MFGIVIRYILLNKRKRNTSDRINGHPGECLAFDYLALYYHQVVVFIIDRSETVDY